MDIRVGGLDVEDRLAVANAIRRQADRFQKLVDTYYAEGVDPGDGPRLRRKVEMLRAVAEAFLEASPPPPVVWKALDGQGRSIMTVPVSTEVSREEARRVAREQLDRPGRRPLLKQFEEGGQTVVLRLL